MPLEDSILKTVKTLLDVELDDSSFDGSLVLYINGAFATFRSLGLGPDDGFRIAGEDTKWSDYLDNEERMESAKVCLALMVKEAFDPPQSSYAVTAMQEQIKEHQYRLKELREVERWTEPVPRLRPDPEL